MADDSKVLVRLKLLGGQIMARDAKRAAGGLKDIDRGGRAAAKGLGTIRGGKVQSELTRVQRGTLLARRGMDNLRTSAMSAGRGLRTAALVGGAVAISGLFALRRGVRSVVEEYTEAAKAGAQTDAVLKSTGGVANVTRKGVERLATAISLKTGIDDEQIQSSQNLLLTFAKIRNETGKGNQIFNRATQTVTDLGVALKTGPRSAAIMLGKALNDPVKGLTAMGRAGVQFSEDQKKQIKGMVESGNVLGAQKAILAEVNKQVAGSAAAQATPMEKLRVGWDNMKEAVGRFAAPTVNRGISALGTFITQMQTGDGAGGALAGRVKKIAGGISDFAKGIGGKKTATKTVRSGPEGRESQVEVPASGVQRAGASIRGALAPVIAWAGAQLPKVGKALVSAGRQLIDAFKPAMPFFQNILLPLLIGIGKGVLGSVVAAFRVAVPIIRIVASVLGFVGRMAAPLKPVFAGIGMAVGFLLGGPILKALGLIPELGIVFRVLGVPLRIVTGAVRGVVGVMGRLAGAFGRAFTFVSRFAGTLTGGARRAAVGAVNMVGGIINVISRLPGRAASLAGRVVSRIASRLGSGVSRIASAAAKLGKGLVTGAVNAIKAAPGALVSALMSLVPGPVKGVVKSALGVITGNAHGGTVRSPLQVVGEHGPELAAMREGSQVVTASDTRRMLRGRRQPTRMAPAGAGGPLYANLNVYLDGRVIHTGVHKVERQKQEAR